MNEDYINMSFEMHAKRSGRSLFSRFKYMSSHSVYIILHSHHHIHTAHSTQVKVAMPKQPQYPHWGYNRIMLNLTKKPFSRRLNRSLCLHFWYSIPNLRSRTLLVERKLMSEEVPDPGMVDHWPSCRSDMHQKVLLGMPHDPECFEIAVVDCI